HDAAAVLAADEPQVLAAPRVGRDRTARVDEADVALLEVRPFSSIAAADRAVAIGQPARLAGNLDTYRAAVTGGREHLGISLDEVVLTDALDQQEPAGLAAGVRHVMLRQRRDRRRLSDADFVQRRRIASLHNDYALQAIVVV